jgi:hypothetical protein
MRPEPIVIVLWCISAANFANETVPLLHREIGRGQVVIFGVVGRGTLKKISERKDQYLYVARRTFKNLFLGVTYVNRDASSLKN